MIRCVALLLLLLLSSLTAATITEATSENEDSAGGIVTIPLIPHHVQKARRRHLIAEKEEKVERPTRYPRFLQDDDDDDDDDDVDDSGKEDYVAPPAQQVAGLFQGYGTHYADLWCGTPPQRQTVIVDTGSGVTAFPCSGCKKDCGVPNYHIDKLFEEGESSSFEKVQCGDCLKGNCDPTKQFCKLGQSYAEGSSWYAFEAQDNCYVGGLHTEPLDKDDKQDNDLDPFHAPAFSFPLRFGCQTRITGLFKTQLADGIMGMDKAAAAFWKQMYKANRIDNQAFSLCFSRSPTAAREGTSAGAMSLGGTDPRLHKTPMVYTAGDNASGFYRVQIRKAYLREGNSGVSAANPQQKNIVPLTAKESVLNTGHVIVDSGTTDTYFHRSFGAIFKRAYKEMSGKNFNNHEVKMTKEEVSTYPTILFQMHGDETRNQAVADKADDGAATVVGLAGELDPENPYDVILAIPPEHYFEYDEESGKYAARFYADESRGSVLGANSMMGHDVLFDVDEKVLGWAESDCDYPAMVNKYFDGKIHVEPSNDEDTKREDTAATDEERLYPEDKSEVEKVERAQEEFCTGFKCQIGFAVILVSMIVLVGWRVAKGSLDGTEEYEAAELEMQTPPSVVMSGSYHDDDGDSGHAIGELS